MTTNESSKTSRKSKKQQQMSDENEAPELSKEEKQIAQYLRLNCPTKQGNLSGVKVDFFISSKLVDCLMESKWGPGTLEPKQPIAENAKQPLFETRQSCIKYIQRLMPKQLFYRVVKVYKETPSDSKPSTTDTPTNVRKRKQANKDDQAQSSPASDQSPDKKTDSQQKRKFKLEMHEEQKFLDGNEPYFWVFEATSAKTYVIGALLILGAIAVCCFPLWPSSVREGVYYVSLAGCAFLGGIIALALFKYVLYAIVWVVTMGGVHFWLFPNLTEDVGFFESFVPVYTCNPKNNKKAKNKAAKSSEVEQAIVEKEEQVVNDDVDLKEEEEGQVECQQVQSVSNKQETLSRDLTESTVEIIKTDLANVKDMEKVQEDYDFELVDNEETELSKDK